MTNRPRRTPSTTGAVSYIGRRPRTMQTNGFARGWEAASSKATLHNVYACSFCFLQEFTTMRKTLIAIALMFSVGCSAAKQTQTNQQPQSIPTKITVTPTEATIIDGQSAEFTATVYDQFGNVMPSAVDELVWNPSSSNSCASWAL